MKTGCGETRIGRNCNTMILGGIWRLGVNWGWFYILGTADISLKKLLWLTGAG